MKHLSLLIPTAFFIAVAALAIFHEPQKSADAATNYSAGAAANLSAPCTFAGATPVAVSVTATAAKTATPVSGKVRIACTAASTFLQGAAGVTGVTALTGSQVIGAGFDVDVVANQSTFSFLRVSADGVCSVTECQ